jgi:hypothetical protein
MILIDLCNEMHNHDVNAQLKAHHDLLDALIFVAQAPTEAKVHVPEWLAYSDRLLGKFIWHGRSMHVLVKGFELGSKHYEEFNQVAADHYSAEILLRAQVECGLIYLMIYDLGATETEKEFAFNCWMYDGLLSRQKFPATLHLSQRVQQADATAMAHLKGQIEASFPRQSLLTRKQVDRLFTGGAKNAERLFKSWAQLATTLRLDGKMSFELIYHLHSVQAHTQSLSILQWKDATPQSNLVVRFAMMFQSCLWMSVVMLSWVRLHKSAEMKFNTLDSELRERILLYASMLRS